MNKRKYKRNYEYVPHSFQLDVRHVSKTFKNEQVLKDVSLTLQSGKIYGFVGRNGSGKSVLFKIICGYLMADEGEVEVDGKVIGKDVDFPERLGVRRHIVGGANRTLFSVDLPPRLCRTGT